MFTFASAFISRLRCAVALYRDPTLGFTLAGAWRTAGTLTRCWS